MTVNDSTIERIVLNSRALGIPVVELKTEDGHTCYFIVRPNGQSILHIPSEAISIGNIAGTSNSWLLSGYTNLNNIKITGGESLENLNKLFGLCNLEMVDFSEFKGYYFKSVYQMFYGCSLNGTDLSFLKTDRVTNMMEMFHFTDLRNVNLNLLNTSNVKCMQDMFRKCRVNELNLSAFDTSKVTNMKCMFNQCTAKKYDLSSFNTFNVESMQAMFYNIEVDELNLSSFTTVNLHNVEFMFALCKIERLDLSNFYITPRMTEDGIRTMFNNAQIGEIITHDERIIESYEKNKRK